MMKRFTISFALISTLSYPVFAQNDQIDCANATAQADMNICAARDYEAADKELNAVWKEAHAAAKETDADQPKEWKGAEKALLAGQRGWIAYRDGQCELAGFEARGGSMEPMIVSGCKADLTRARTKELRDTLLGEQ
jgi:uncharacterized protein YecT (DUF1311 family)